MRLIRFYNVFHRAKGKSYLYLQFKYLFPAEKVFEEGIPTVIAFNGLEIANLKFVLERFLELEYEPEDVKKFAQELLYLLKNEDKIMFPEGDEE